MMFPWCFHDASMISSQRKRCFHDIVAAEAEQKQAPKQKRVIRREESQLKCCQQPNTRQRGSQPTQSGSQPPPPPPNSFAFAFSSTNIPPHQIPKMLERSSTYIPLNGCCPYHPYGVFYCKRFAQSARPGLEKAWLLEFFFAILESLVSILVHFSIIGNTLGALGAHCSVKKQFGPPKVSQEAPTLETTSLFGIHLGVIFWTFFDFLGYVLSIVLCSIFWGGGGGGGGGGGRSIKVVIINSRFFTSTRLDW